jgi:hypothetical protein
MLRRQGEQQRRLRSTFSGAQATCHCAQPEQPPPPPSLRFPACLQSWGGGGRKHRTAAAAPGRPQRCPPQHRPRRRRQPPPACPLPCASAAAAACVGRRRCPSCSPALLLLHRLARRCPVQRCRRLAEPPTAAGAVRCRHLGSCCRTGLRAGRPSAAGLPPTGTRAATGSHDGWGPSPKTGGPPAGMGGAVGIGWRPLMSANKKAWMGGCSETTAPGQGRPAGSGWQMLAWAG